MLRRALALGNQELRHKELKLQVGWAGCLIIPIPFSGIFTPIETGSLPRNFLK